MLAQRRARCAAWGGVGVFGGVHVLRRWNLCAIRCRQDAAPRMDPVPGLGEHTDALLAELGLDAAAIQALHDAGAV